MESQKMCYNRISYNYFFQAHRFVRPMRSGQPEAHRSSKPMLYQERRSSEPRVGGSNPSGRILDILHCLYFRGK